MSQDVGILRQGSTLPHDKGLALQVARLLEECTRCFQGLNFELSVHELDEAQPCTQTSTYPSPQCPSPTRISNWALSLNGYNTGPQTINRIMMRVPYSFSPQKSSPNFFRPTFTSGPTSPKVAPRSRASLRVQIPECKTSTQNHTYDFQDVNPRYPAFGYCALFLQDQRKLKIGTIYHILS